MKALFRILFFSVFFFTSETKGCGGGDYYDEDYYSDLYIFSPELLTDTSLVKYKNISNHRECDVCRKSLISATTLEWKNRFPECSEVDINRALFVLLNKNTINQIRGHTNPQLGNTFFAYLLENNLTEYLSYLEFIYEENTLISNNIEEISWQEENTDYSKFYDLISLAKENLTQAPDDFLKQRYIFQIVKLLHITKKYDQAIAFYDGYYSSDNTFPQNLIYYRTLGYYAGSIRKTGNPVLAKYTFAKIFNSSPTLRYQAYKDFKFIDQNSDQWEKSLSLAKTNSEISAMLIAKNIYDYYVDIVSLQKLYETDTSYTRLELALIKKLENIHLEYIVKLKDRINLDEEKIINTFSLNKEYEPRNNVSNTWYKRIWASIVNFFRSIFKLGEVKVKWEDVTPDIKYEPFVYSNEGIPELLELLTKIENDPKVINKELYTLAKGYIQIVNKDFDKGQKTLILLFKSQKPVICQLSNYFYLFSKIQSESKITSELENAIIAHNTKYSLSKEMLLELGKRYFIEKQYDKSLLVFLKSNEKVGFTDKLNDEELLALIKTGNNNISANFQSYFGKLNIKKLKSDYARRSFLRGEFQIAADIQNDEIFSSGKRVSYSDLSRWDKSGTIEDLRKIAEVFANSSSLPYNSIPCYNDYDYPNAERYPFNIPELAEAVNNRANYLSKLNYSTDLAESYFRKIHDKSDNDIEKAKALIKAQKVAMRDKYALKDKYDEKSKKINKAFYYKELKEKYGNEAVVQELNNSCSFMQNEKILYYGY